MTHTLKLNTNWILISNNNTTTLLNLRAKKEIAIEFVTNYPTKWYIANEKLAKSLEKALEDNKLIIELHTSNKISAFYATLSEYYKFSTEDSIAYLKLLKATTSKHRKAGLLHLLDICGGSMWDGISDYDYDSSLAELNSLVEFYYPKAMKNLDTGLEYTKEADKEAEDLDSLTDMITKYKTSAEEPHNSQMLEDIIDCFPVFANAYIVDDGLTRTEALKNAIAHINSRIAYDLERGSTLVTAVSKWLQGLPLNMPFSNYEIEKRYNMSNDSYWEELATHVIDIMSIDFERVKSDKVKALNKLITERLNTPNIDGNTPIINKMTVEAFSKYALNFQTDDTITDLEALRLTALHVFKCVEEIKKNYCLKGEDKRSIRNALNKWVRGLPLELPHTKEELAKIGIDDADTYWYCVSEVLTAIVTCDYKHYGISTKEALESHLVHYGSTYAKLYNMHLHEDLLYVPIYRYYKSIEGDLPLHLRNYNDIRALGLKVVELLTK